MKIVYTTNISHGLHINEGILITESNSKGKTTSVAFCALHISCKNQA